VASREQRRLRPTVREVYLDHAATTPLCPEARRAYGRAATALWANPSSVHAAGRRARAAVEAARAEVAGLAGGRPEDWIFTSGGTEANNLAVFGAAGAAARRGRRHLVVAAVEHHSVLDAAAALGRQGWDVTLVPPAPDGTVPSQAMVRALRADTALCCLMVANNEVGALQPVQEVAAACRALGVAMHADAVAALGRIPIDVEALGVDLLSLSAHKIYGPKGIGALYVRPGLELEPLLHGGGQERRWRPGTENVPAIVAFGAAAVRARRVLAEEARRLRALGQRVLAAVVAADLGAVPTGPLDWERRLPGLCSFVFPGLDGEALLASLDLQGIRVGAGAACTAGSLRASHVLLAMGVAPEVAGAALRVSLGCSNGEDDVAALVEALGVAVARQRGVGRGAGAAPGAAAWP
jgi:cysteine desulfurase